MASNQLSEKKQRLLSFKEFVARKSGKDRADLKRQIVEKEEASKLKRQLKRFRENFVGGQVIREEVEEVQVTDAAFITFNGSMAMAEQRKAIKGFANEVTEMARDGRTVIATALALD